MDGGKEFGSINEIPSGVIVACGCCDETRGNTYSVTCGVYNNETGIIDEISTSSLNVYEPHDDFNQKKLLVGEFQKLFSHEKNADTALLLAYMAWNNASAAQVLINIRQSLIKGNVEHSSQLAEAYHVQFQEHVQRSLLAPKIISIYNEYYDQIDSTMKRIKRFNDSQYRYRCIIS